MFILSTDGRDEDVNGQFNRYREYLEKVKPIFPPRAYTLATSEWYYSGGHRSPHDAWLESATVQERSDRRQEGRRCVSLIVRLLAAYHDGHIELTYDDVRAYKFDVPRARDGHFDWRYDELRLSEQNLLLHEIEWSGPGETGRWLIEASDVKFRWLPKAKRKARKK